MKKRFLAFFIVVIMAVGYLPASYAAGLITISEPKFENGKIKVTASVDKANDIYSMIVVRKGGDPKDLNDRYGMREGVSDKNKIVSFTFKLPETREILKSDTNPNGYTDGEYTITVKGRSANKAKKDFYFVTEGMKLVVAEMILESSESALKGYFEKNSSYRTTLINMGFDFSEYDEQNSEIKSKIVSEFFAKMTNYEDNLGEAFNSSVKLVVMSKDAESVIAQLEQGGYEFEGTKYTDLEQDVKDWIVVSYLEHGKFDDIEEFEKMYSIANMLYIINKSKFHEVEGNLAKYAEALEITDSSEYKTYKSLDSDDRLATSETLIYKLSKSPARTVEVLLARLSDSKTEASSESKKDYEDKVNIGLTASSTGTVGEVTTTETKEAFSDLGSVLWAKDAIKYLYDRKMIAGVGDGKFDPNGMITREQFATMIVNAMGMYDATAVTDFTDVESGSWYEKNVASAQKNGIIEGISDNKFGVGKNITRQDVAVIIARCAENMGLQLVNDSDELFDDDSLIAEYAKESVYTLTSAGIINGVGDNKFAPTGNCTRAQAARLVYLLLTYVDGDEEETGKASADIVSKFGFLKGLGMFGGATADLININATILKGKFIQNAMRLVCGEEVPDSQLLEIAKDYGIGATEDYDYDEKMSFEEACSIVLQLSTLGIGGDINESAVQSYKSSVIRGTTETGSEPISQGSVINLLYNAAKYEGIMAMSLTNKDVSYSNLDNTILEAKRNITKVVGIVTDNEMTSLNGASTVGAGEVKIDSIIALEGTSGASQYLGKRVEAYIYFGDDENKVIYIEDKKKSDELVISAEIFDSVNTSKRTIMYEDGDKIKTVKYSAVLKFIKNGRYYPGYDKEDFEITSGAIRLIDNNGDKEYDVLFVEKYSHIIANGVSLTKDTVRNIYQTPSNFDFSLYNDYSIIYNGSEVALSEVTQKDVLTILATDETGLDGKATAYLTRNKISGKVRRIDTEKGEITIDGIAYKLSDAYLAAEKASDSAYTPIRFNGEYDFYLDYFGKIAYVEAFADSSEYSYVYATKAYHDDESVEDTYMLKYFTLGSQWEKTKFAEKVRYNGTSVKIEALANNLLNDFTPEVVRIKRNSDGEISGIETPRVSADPNSFDKRAVSGTWSANSYALVDNTSGGGLQMLLDSSTKVFLIPESGEEREYSIGSRGRFSTDATYTITGYGFNEYKIPDVVIFSKDTTVSAGSSVLVVRSKEETLVNDLATTVLHGSTDKNAEYTAVASKPELFSDVEPGDFIVYNTNELDEVENYMKLWGLSDYGTKMTSKTWNSNTLQFVDNEFNKGAAFLSGFVKDIDYNGMMMIVDTGSTDPQIINGKNDVIIPKVFIYDRKTKTTELTNMDDILPGDFVFMRCSWTRLAIVYVIR